MFDNRSKPQWFYPTIFPAWDDEEHTAIKRVVDSGWFTQGPEVEALEHEFAAFHGMKHSIAVNSGSSANLVAVAALFNKSENPLKPGDIAEVPAISWGTLYAPLVQHGLELSLLDCDATWNAAWPSTAAQSAKLIVGCSILGNPAHLKQWSDEAAATKKYFIEDNCESLGAWYGPLDQKRYTGTFGILNTFSFFHSHQLGAVEGGMILTNDDELARLCRMLRDHGLTRGVCKPEKFSDEYCFEYFGWNVRATEIYAAIARVQLQKLESMCRQRQQNLNNFITAAIGLPVNFPRNYLPRHYVPSPFGISFSVESEAVRERLVNAFRADGIDCRLPTGGSFRKHPYAARWADQQTPNADMVHDTGLFIGNAPHDIAPQIERAIKVIKETL